MIVLGEQHQFSPLELNILRENFTSIDFIPYKNINSKIIIQRLEAFIKSSDHQKSIIILNTKARVPNELLTYLIGLESSGVSYFSIESFMENYLEKCFIPEDQTNIDFLEKVKPYSRSEYVLKRIIDFSGIFFISILTFPIMFYSAYRIRKESPGSIFYKQTRVGYLGQKIVCYKFRSMHENSHHDPYTKEDDIRVFPWGKIMRKTRIDELPQLFNVLKGDMHILGPRAEWDILVNMYEKKIPYYHQRHMVKPGITGWAQVMYPYGSNIDDAKQKLMFDLFYIKHWNLLFEIRIILKTILIVIKRKGI